MESWTLNVEVKLGPDLKGPGMLYVRHLNVFPNGVGSHRKFGDYV